MNPYFHPQKWRGWRKSKFNIVDTIVIRLLLWFFVEEDPTFTLQEYTEHLSILGFNVSRNYVRRIFKSWRWSWKVPQYKQIAKYTNSNIDYYGNYLSWIHLQPTWLNVKFLDEVHFVHKGIYYFYMILTYRYI